MFDFRSLPLCLGVALGACSDAPTNGMPQVESDAGGPAESAAELEFTTDEVELVAGASAELVVLARSLEGPVRFSIQGDAPGAYLSQSEVVPDEEGRATVRVTAPGEPASFVVVASGGGAEVEVDVVVRGGGVTRLLVNPRYDGVRSLESWTVDVHVGTLCEAVQDESPRVSVRAAAAELPVLVLDVPAGEPLSVVVESGDLARGCTDVAALLAAETTAVDVPARDFPLRLGEALEIRFRLEPSAEFSSLLQARIAAIGAAARSQTGDDIDDLLDAMASELDPPLRAGFDAARAERDWYSRVGMALTEDAKIRTVSSLIESLLLEGTQHLYSGDWLVGVVSGAEELPGPTSLEWQTIAELGAVRAGFPEAVQATATPEAGDTLRIGATVPWLPDQLLLSLLEEDLEAIDSSVPEALAERLPCSDVAVALTSALTVDEMVTTVDAFEGCDRACTERLCVLAVERLWNRSLELEPTESTLQLAAAGVASVGTDTNVLAFSGNWLGTSTVTPEENVPVRGTFDAAILNAE